MKLGYGSRRILLATIACLVLAYCPVLPAQQQWRWSEASRIVVVPDVHGAHAELVGLLQASGIIDASLRWNGGDARLVSLGDLLDRGAESRKVMDLFMRLQREAAEHGGAVHIVLGNHEVMNLMGDLRYVSEAEYAAFLDEEPEDVRESAYRQFLLHQPQTLAEDEAAELFARSYPPGYFGHRLAFGLDGRYGSWLLSQPSLIVIESTAFVHGGLPELLARTTAGEVNQRVHDTLRRYLEIRSRLADAGVLPPYDMRGDVQWSRDALRVIAERSPGAERASEALLEELAELGDAPELGLDGPLWYRGSVYCSRLLERPALEAALGKLDAARVVVGHTPTENRRAREMHDGRLIMLDTGMLTSHYSGRPAALLIEGDRTSVQYSNPVERLPLERGSMEAHGLTEAEIIDALSQGVIDASGESGRELPARVVVRHGGNVIRAILYPGGRGRAADFELAAHALDRLLGLHLVPPTVAREVHGSVAALQLHYPDAITESERMERRLSLGGWCPIEPQLQLMYAFDALINNPGRAPDNVLYRPELSTLKLIDHGRAFSTALRPRLDGFVLLPALRESLESLDRENVQSSLGDWLNTRQIRTLMERRDALLQDSAAE